jgi:hypothetical protein
MATNSKKHKANALCFLHLWLGLVGGRFLEDSADGEAPLRFKIRHAKYLYVVTIVEIPIFFLNLGTVFTVAAYFHVIILYDKQHSQKPPIFSFIKFNFFIAH